MRWERVLRKAEQQAVILKGMARPNNCGRKFRHCDSKQNPYVNNFKGLSLRSKK